MASAETVKRERASTGRDGGRLGIDPTRAGHGRGRLGLDRGGVIVRGPA